MSSRKVLVTIGTEGQPTITTDGFVGSACLAATAGLESKFGGGGTQDLKPEFFQEEVVEEQHVSHE